MGSGPDGPMQFRSISDTLPKIIVNYLILLENISFVNIFLRDNSKKMSPHYYICPAGSFLPAKH